MLRHLSFGVVCPDGDCNFPGRAEAIKSIDIENMKSVGMAVGIKPGDVVVDVGGFVGDSAHAFASFGGKVLVFEPFLDNYVSILYNCRDLDVTAVNLPCGNGEHVKLVYECPGPNFGMRSVVETTDPSCIRTARIDDYGLKNVKFMKIDCEGSEIPTIKGAEQTIRRDRPILFVEAYEEGLNRRGDSIAKLTEYLKSLDYDLEMWGAPPRWDWMCRPRQ